MTEPANKTQFLDMVRGARRQLDALLAKVDKADMTQPGACGEWSVKDVVAHIVWHEREMIGLLKAHALVGSELWNLPTDQRNAAIFEENKERELDDVLEESPATFEQMMTWLDTLAEEDLFDASRFPGMPAEWRPLDVLASNTYEHYHDHIPQIEAWLAKKT